MEHSNSSAENESITKNPIPTEHYEEKIDHSLSSCKEDSSPQIGFETSEDELPRGYYFSPRFIGSYFAFGFFAMGGFGGFGLIAPVLDAMAKDIGNPLNSSQVNWLALVYTLCLAVGGTLVGRFTDIFGRRWFFIAGAALGVVGAIVYATAKNIPVAIGGQTLIGLPSAISFAYPFAIAELYL
jgi:Fungal trichothecene efflux pump (TRI12)